MDESRRPSDARQARPAAATELDYATVWESIADHLPDLPAIRQGGRVESWAAFDDRSARLAAALQEHGIGPHDSVGVYLYNRPEFFETYFAAFKVRARPFNVNYRYRGDEFLRLLDIADAKALVYDVELRDVVMAVADRLPPLRVIVEVGPPAGATVPGAVRLDDLVATTAPAARVERAPDDHYLNFTGGTTGLPKGVLVEVGRSIGTAMWSRGTYFGIPGDVPPLDAALRCAAAGTLPSTIPASPLMHSVGFIFSSLPTLITGGCVTLLEHRSFDAHELLRAVGAVRAELLAIVGDAFAVPIVRALDEGPGDGAAYDTSSLRTICTSGVALSAQLKGRLLDQLAQVTIVDACGTTEGVNYGTRRVRRGDPLATARFDAAPGLKVLSPTDEVLPAGEIGMLAGPTHGRGYFGDPERTAATYRVVDGVLHAVPGDLGRIEPDGTFTLIGRGVTTINTGGEKVHPHEVEEVIRALPEVDECLVLGVPDERFGQSVAALVVLAPLRTLGTDAVVEAVRTSLAGYKVPRRVRFVERVPRAPNGKVDYPAASAIAEAG
jgi:fatty-acyl-CoA synthase